MTDLYHGAFLQGIDLPLGVELEEWVFATRERIGMRVRDAHIALAEEALQQGASSEAARHAALALGVAEAPELEPEQQQRLLQLVDGKRHIGLPLRAGLSAVHRSLPNYSTSFVGRHRELDRVRKVLADPTCRLLTLHGPGGIGKSRLAAQVARELLLEDRFRDGVAFVELSSIGSDVQLLPQIAASLEFQLQPQQGALEQLLGCLADKHLLLVLDNFEHLMDGARVAADLVAGAPDLTIVVTSREPLRLLQEHVLTLQGLAVPRANAVPEDAKGSDSVRLFRERALQVRQRPLPPDDLPHVVHLCELLDGSPLAIELSAAWLRALPLPQVVAEVASDFDVLTSNARNAAERHRSIRHVFEHSWRFLAEQERDCLRRLSVFQGGFTRLAAERVANANLALLVSLVDKSLLRPVEQLRYDFHPLLQQYAREKLRERVDEEKASGERHARHYFDLLKQQQRTFPSKSPAEAAAELEQELENLRVAWQLAGQARWTAELRQASPLLRHAFDKRGQCREGIRLYEETLTLLGEDDGDNDAEDNKAARGRILIDQAHFYHYLGDHRAAMERVKSGIDLLERHGEDIEVRDGLNLLGGSLWREGRCSEAKLSFERSLYLSRLMQDQRGVANGLSYLAVVEQTLGNFDNAELRCLEALDICRKADYGAQTAIVLKNYGALLRVTGRPGRARELLEEASDVAPGSSARVTSDIQTTLALCLLDLGRPADARRSAGRAVSLAGASRIPAFEILALAALGRSETALGDERSALQHLTLALAKAVELDNEPLTLTVLTALGEANASSGRRGRAKQLLDLVCRHPRLERHNRRLAERILRGLGDATEPVEKDETPESQVDGTLDGLFARAAAKLV